MTQIDDALAIASAVSALRLKGAMIRGTRDGVEIHQRGKPVLLLTADAARRFAHERAEAEAAP